MSAQLEVGPLGPGDWTRWLPLARAYKSFYLSDLSDAAAQQAWQRLMAGDGVFGLGVRQRGEARLKLGGSQVHALLQHAAVEAPKLGGVCSSGTRGRGARALQSAHSQPGTRLAGCAAMAWRGKQTPGAAARSSLRGNCTAR